MSIETNNRDLNNIKIAAKRLRKFIPDKKHSELLDIASYQLKGVASYHEAKKNSSQSLIQSKTISKIFSEEFDRKLYKEVVNEEPILNRGDWFFFPQDRTVVFEGEYTPYVIEIDRINSSSEYLDWILQLHKKRWPEKMVKTDNISPTYQVDEFISLIDDLCFCYFNEHSQAIFSPSGKFKKVEWPENMLDQYYEKKMEFDEYITRSKQHG